MTQQPQSGSCAPNKIGQSLKKIKERGGVVVEKRKIAPLEPAEPRSSRDLTSRWKPYAKTTALVGTVSEKLDRVRGCYSIEFSSAIT